MIARSLVAFALIGAGAASAQNQSKTAIDQISPDIRPLPDPTPTAERPPLDVRQVTGRSEARTPTRQLSARDRNPRLAAVPANLVDACEESARGRWPAPEGVDCASILETIARPLARRSAEEVLLLGDGRDAQQGPVPAPLVPNADQVARQLGQGADIDNAPVAQAVGSRFQAPTVVPPTGSAATPPVIVPGGAGGLVVIPPG